MYRALTEVEVIDYVKSIPNLFSDASVLESREIGDGNLNMVFQVGEVGGEGEVLLSNKPYPI